MNLGGYDPRLRHLLSFSRQYHHDGRHVIETKQKSRRLKEGINVA